MPGQVFRSFLVIACVALVGCATTTPSDETPRRIEFSQIKDEALIGKLVRVRACIGIPLSTVVDEEEFVLLFPCDAPRDESLAEVLVLAQGASEQVFQPMTGARVDIENDIEAVLTGRVSRRRLDDEDLTEYPFVTIHSISKPRERVR
jgi:hypothetical protein